MKKHEPAGLVAGEWESLFRKAGIAVDKLDAAKSTRAKTTILGAFLSQNVGREVAIEAGGRTGTAKLCVEPGRARKKLYHLEVTWDQPAEEEGKGLDELGLGDDAEQRGGGDKAKTKVTKKKLERVASAKKKGPKNVKPTKSPKTSEDKSKMPPRKRVHSHTDDDSTVENQSSNPAEGNTEAW